MPGVADRFKTSSSSPVFTSATNISAAASGVYRSTGNITISGGTLSAGKWIVINAPSSNVTISGNIQYANGPFTDASQLPQLVIIAQNITITDSVERVDAWLVAPGTVATNGSVSNGVIRTCSSMPAQISDSVCNKRLTVNGPVIANKLIMLRSGGAGVNECRGDPAEVFNFRPDAYMWAAQQAESGGRVTTVSTKELPPRY
jgi:hypothetical protein